MECADTGNPLIFLGKGRGRVWGHREELKVLLDKL